MPRICLRKAGKRRGLEEKLTVKESHKSFEAEDDNDSAVDGHTPYAHTKGLEGDWGPVEFITDITPAQWHRTGKAEQWRLSSLHL